MVYFDIELIDINVHIENFKFSKILERELKNILSSFKENKDYLEFNSLEGAVVIKTEHIRGIMYQEYTEKEKTTLEENIESAEEVSKIKLKKTIFNSTN